MSTSSSNSSLNYMSAAMPVALPLGFARPPTPAAPNTTQPIEELEERVTELEIQNETDDRIETLQEQVDEADNRIDELEIQNDRLKTGMHNFNVDRNEADDRIDDLERQVGDLFSLVMRMNAPCTCSKPASKPPSPENLLLGEMNRLRISRGSQSSQ